MVLRELLFGLVGTISMLTLAPAAHEAAHAAAARLVGGEVVDIGSRPGWRGFYVDYRAPSQLKARIVGAAPMLSGSTIGLFWLSIFGLPAFSVGSVVAVGNWLIYTFSGGVADLSMRAAQETANN